MTEKLYKVRVNLSFKPAGSLVNYAILAAVVAEARVRGCPVLEFGEIGAADRTAVVYNQTADWLADNYPEEFMRGY